MSGDSSGSKTISLSDILFGEAKAKLDKALEVELGTKLTCGWEITLSVIQEILLTSLVVIVSAGAFVGLVMGSAPVFFSATLLAILGTRLTCGWAIILVGMEEILLITFVV